jgi:hypothetical protein
MIYKHHNNAFKNIKAGALVKDGKQLGTLAFKHGASRVTCYLHLFGTPMVSGSAGGYGYDKTTTAFVAACSRTVELKEATYDGQSFEQILIAHGITYMGAV